MPEISLGITGLHEILGRDAGLKNSIGDPLISDSLRRYNNYVSKRKIDLKP